MFQSAWSGRSASSRPQVSKMLRLWRATVRSALMAAACAAPLLISGDSFALGQNQDPVIAKSELAVGRFIKNYRMTGHNGEYFPLHKLKGAPLLVSFMFIDCQGPCHLINQSIKNFRSKIDPALIEKTNILSITLDTQSDSPAKLKEYGFQFSGGAENWIFATADQATVDMLVKDLGFDYTKTANGLEHLNRLTLVGPDGMTLKHYYGADFDPKEIESALRAAVSGSFVISNKLSGALNSIMLTCSAFDPSTNTYKVSGFLLAQWVLQYLLVFCTVIFFFKAELLKLVSFLIPPHLFKSKDKYHNLAALDRVE